MTREEWLASTDPVAMLEAITTGLPPGRHTVGGHSSATARHLRLFACACTRQVWHLLTDERSRRAVEAAELLADGLVTREEAEEVKEQSYKAVAEIRDDMASRRAADEAHMCLTDDATYAARYKTLPQLSVSHGVQVALLHEIIGDPFRTPLALHAWNHKEARKKGQNLPLKCKVCGVEGRRTGHYNRRLCPWSFPITPRAATIAGHAYRERDWGVLPVLADALEDAGCAEADLLVHLRGPGPHARGCWATDLILGRE
jgi:hypothetical protein